MVKTCHQKLFLGSNDHQKMKLWCFLSIKETKRSIKENLVFLMVKTYHQKLFLDSIGHQKTKLWCFFSIKKTEMLIIENRFLDGRNHKKPIFFFFYFRFSFFQFYFSFSHTQSVVFQFYKQFLQIFNAEVYKPETSYP